LQHYQVRLRCRLIKVRLAWLRDDLFSGFPNLALLFVSERQQKMSMELIIGDSNKIYYWLACPGYWKAAQNNPKFFMSWQQAERAGYKPASNCL
jgi:hypothetical protein